MFYNYFKGHRLIFVISLVSIIAVTSFIIIYIKCKNHCTENNGFITTHCFLSSIKIIGIKNGSMYLTYNEKGKYEKIGLAPLSLLVWYPLTETTGTLSVFHTQFGYKNIPLDEHAITDLVSKEQIKLFQPFKLELKYRTADGFLELSKDSNNWERLSVTLTDSTVIKWEDSDIPLPSNKVRIYTSWFEGEYEYVWDNRITLEEQKESVRKHYQLFL